MKNHIPNPGSKEAQEKGCKCPVMDNHYGKGYYGDGKIFVIMGNCTLHNKEVKNETKKK